ncbi:HNH endonuclease signature motif containing protein [Rhodococcoides yunnanense]|uniref:DUF222 domain-containing protein n=1 Tax=Rhodococcoides yunnanense TaxID=278209 RepID=A0ABU4BJF1_9NOCA|nr:DUF222 domain-containing protein [Rhodococcus yunnanensis]MDV6264342.1 DUF222 domain-containing protein [Rhodococcus yunnanensis]
MAVPTVSLEALTAAAQAENRLAARKIAACYRVHCDWITLDVEHKHYSRYGLTEMAVALGCSATVAESYVSVGVALHTRLPLLRRAFETGQVDLPRVRTVCRILDNLSDDIVNMVEDEIVEAAQRNSPGPLEKEIWDILLRVAPEEAAALREFAKRFRHVSYSPAGELARIRAELTAPEAAAAWQLLEEMADTVCSKDPRGKKERLCDAFMARMHGEPRLACLCQRDDCPKKDADAVLPDRRVPLTMITVDIATLLGLLANPAYLAGHGSIDPGLARELARNSHWQVLLTEAVTLAEKLGLAVQDPETGEWERRPDSETAGAATGPETGTGTDADRDAELDVDAAADAATTAHADGGIGSATDSGREADSATAPTSPNAPAPAPARAPGNTSAPAPPTPEAPAPVAPADEVHETADTGENDETEQNDDSTPVPSTDPSATPDPNAIDPVRKHAATRATAPMAGPRPEATPGSGPGSTSSQAHGPGPNRSQSGCSATPSDSATSGSTSAQDPAPGTGAAAAAASNDRHQRRLGSLTSAAALFCTHTPVGKGTRHSSALDLPTAIRRNRTIGAPAGRTPTNHTPAGIYLGNASLAAALEAAIAADPTLAKSVARDPLTDRALIYRPDTLTTAAVRLRDRHCRFPGCHRPADRCQLDHIIAFDHTNPLGGGWTTINNLQCLCEFHHTVKTAGYWSAVMLPGGAILWTSTSKTTRITLPTNGTAVPIIGNDLRPNIPTKPKRSGVVAYPHPPDNHEPESEATFEDTDEPPF